MKQTFKHYSNLMGKCDAFLSAYCYFNKIKGTPKEIYDIVQKRIKYENEIVQKMQDLYYELSDKGAKAEFGRYCASKGLFKHDIQLNQSLESSFIIERENLIKLTQIKRMETILGYYEEFKKDKK